MADIRAAPAIRLPRLGVNPLFATTVVLCVVIFALWLPVGWNVTPISENWRNRALIEGYTSRRIEERFIYELQSRPLMLLPPTLAHTISPDTSVGFNLLAAVIFVAKGVLLFLILRRLLPITEAFAFFAAVLFVVYPADEGVMTLRSLIIHADIVYYLLATYLLLLYWERPHPLKLAGMMISLALTFGTYEAAYPLWALTPLMLVWKEKRLSRRVLRVSLLWYLVPCFFLVNTFLSFLLPGSKQMRNLTTGISESSGVGDFLAARLRDFFTIYERSFITGWQSAMQALLNAQIPLLFAGLSGATALITGFWLQREAPPRRENLRLYGLLIVVGLALVLLLTLFYFVTSRIDHEWRVYLFSSIGASLVVTSLIYAFSARFKLRWAFPVLMSLLIMLATARNIEQHTFYAAQSKQEQHDLLEVVEVVPRLKAPAYLLFVTPESFKPDDISNVVLWRVGSGLHEALSVIYDHLGIALLGVESCYSKNVRCDILPSGVLVNDEGVEIMIAYEQMVIVEVSDSVKLLTELPPAMAAQAESPYAPLTLVDQASALPGRVFTLFGN